MNNRVKRLQEELVKNNIDYAIIGPTSNMQYLIDFTEEQMERPLLLIISQDDYYILAPKLYEEQLSKFPLLVYNDGENPYSKLNLKENSSLLIDDKLYSLFTIEILNIIKTRRVYRASAILDKLRMIKDEDEILRMSEGVKIAENLFLNFIQTLAEGLTECEIQRKFKSYIMEKAGDISFEPILTSGPNTSMPHLRCTERKVKKGDIVVFDFGVKYKGYSTDTTRVVSLGNPADPNVKKIFEIVKEANEAAEGFARKGVLASEIDSEARKIIEMNGYGKFFIHRTGHGIGIDVHEAPYISSDNKEKIENGEIFTIEPGIYLPNKFGIRIEDEILILNGTSKVLNSLDKELFII